MNVKTAPKIISIVLLFFAAVASAQSSAPVTITTTEPGRLSLAELFRAADTVALVKIVSGDTENYATALYKAEVLRAFKGTEKGSTLYFGPYVGNRLGDEYLLFLRNATELATPKTAPSAMYGTVRYSKVFNEGYSSMSSRYQCVFDGKDASQTCDYGIRVCTDYITLPKTVKTFPSRAEDTEFGCRWIRKAEMEAVVENIASEVTR